jgi:hypothetical protein
LYLALTAPTDGAPSWGTEWISDFERILTLNSEIPIDQEDIPHFSLVTGKLVDAQNSKPMQKGPATEIQYESNGALIKQESQVAIREDGTVSVKGVRSLAGERLISRSWRGLDPSRTQEEGAEVQPGRDGVARGYRHLTNLDLK